MLSYFSFILVFDRKKHENTVLKHENTCWTLKYQNEITKRRNNNNKKAKRGKYMFYVQCPQGALHYSAF